MSAKIWVLAGLLTSAVPADALAQGPPTTDQAPAGDTQRTDGRDLVGTATTGDVGLWFVPLADTNGRGRWRGGVARTSRNTVQGHLNVADFTASVSYGLWDRADVFVSWDAVARVDRDVRPLYIPGDSERGGIDPAAPFARESWSGNQRADLRIGAKAKVVDEYTGAPVSLALRGIGHVPTGDYEAGGGVGAPAFDVDAILSRWAGSRFVVSGSAGYAQRNNPQEPVEVRIPPLFTWGGGVGFLPWQTLLMHAEVIGEHPLKRDTTDLSQRLTAADGSLSPMLNLVDNHRAIAAGMTWMARSGFFVGAAAKWDFPMRDRATGTRVADYTDIQVRIGWRPGVRSGSAIAKTAPEPVAPAVDTTAADREAAERAAAAERTAAERAAAERAAAEKAAAAAAAAAPAPAHRELVFEDVYFDFDRYSLRPEALRILDEVVRSMNEAKTMRMIIEGHTCSIGTTEYNLALGERRAHAVYQYLTSHGVAASRLSYVTFGEERPKFDNTREETRRLNRRAAMVMRLETTDHDLR